jgi:CheY-like chemotaxis protein
VDTDAGATTRPTRLDGVQLLIVEDDARVRDALQILLQRAGAGVDVVESASSAREALELIIPDVVLSDIAMPGEDGCSFVRKMRQGGDAIRAIPAVAITAHATAGDRALAAGFDLFVVKPVNVDRLIAAIAELVEAKRLEK